MDKHETLVAKLESNWSLYEKLVGKIKNTDVRKSLQSLLPEIRDRLAATPASTQTKFIGAFPGGLVEHSLNVLRATKNISESVDSKISSDNLIVVCLFHDLGKIGNNEEDYYNEKKSAWHNERGIMYEINDNLTDLSVAHRSLWWLNKFCCPLSEDEFGAIASLANVGHSTYSNQFYNSSLLTVVLQAGIRVACIQGSNKQSILG